MGSVHIKVSDLAFGYPGHPVLSGVSFTISQGARLALVGENGSGKTTLLRLLTGHLKPTAGNLEVVGDLAFVPQELIFGADQTVGDLFTEALEQVTELNKAIEAQCAAFDHEQGHLGELSALLSQAEHLAVWDAPRRIDVALTRLNACRDQTRLLAELSVGERFRVRLACTLAQRSEILLLDEPTNHLDSAGLDFLTQELLAWRGLVIVVTHDRMLLDDVATGILDLDPSMDGTPVLYGQPGYLSYRFAKNEALRRWSQRYKAERKRAVLLEHRLDRSYEGLSDEWRPPKGSQKNRRQTGARIHVKAADRLVEQLKAQAVDIPVPPPAFRFPDLPARAAQWDGASTLIDLRNVAVGGPDRPRLDLPGLRLTIEPSGRLLITGANGSGKSTLLSVLAGHLRPDRGLRTVHPGVRMGVLRQEGPSAHAEANTEMGSIGQLTGEHTPKPLGEPERQETSTCFERYGLLALRLLEQGALDPNHLVPLAQLGLMSEENLDRPVNELSVGQRRRFDLACALLAAPHILVLDEPTNHLSIDLVDDLTQALRKTAAAVIVATHDRRMQEDLSDWPRLELT